MRHYLGFGLTSIAMLLLAACDQQAPAVTKSETSATQQESIAKAEQAAPLPSPKLKLIETAPKPLEDSLDPISAVATVYRTMQ